QPLLGNLERGARARARLEEQVHDRLPAQRRDLLDRPLRDLAHRLGGVEHEVDLFGREIRDAQQILLHPWISTSSVPSISARRTCAMRASVRPMRSASITTGTGAARLKSDDRVVEESGNRLRV